MQTKADVNVRLQGFTAANRDAQVILTSEATGHTTTTKPFLDGTVTVRDLDPGMYELEVRHPNLILPIEKRRIRVFPQPQPTQINIHVPEVIFKDRPIADIPDADLTPVRTAAAAAQSQAQAVGTKSPGEAILAADWNKLAHAVSDLAGAVAQLTQLVSPQGHNHPEIAAKIDEVQGNLRAFADAFGRSVLEIRRQFELDALKHNTDNVLTAAETPAPVKKEILDKIDVLQNNVLVDTPLYTQQLANIGALLQNKINEVAIARGDAGATFLKDPQVAQLSERTRAYTVAGVQTKSESELLVYQKSSSAARAAGR